MYNESEFLEILKEANKNLNYQINQERAEKRNKRNERLLKGNRFSLDIVYRDSVKYDDRKTRESIRVEGLDNGLALLEVYRKMGFSLKIQKLTLNMEHGKIEKVKRIDFKYKGE